MAQAVRWTGNRFRRKRRAALPGVPSDFIWALKDVSFQVERGQVLGVIGRDGAGKSTLLKVLATVTEPTEGEAEVVGRVGSLLEVGTGFHPELTGRENIYLNGAILGMRKKAETNHKFDEIVEFAEIGKFIDTPVKRYSSGMYVRLAFAVAAHLESEILLVDEVLAVGDAAFQKKCLGKMGDVATEGRTVLFVSHNMSAILRLTEETVLIKGGRLRAIRDETSKVVNSTLSSGLARQDGGLTVQRTSRPGGAIPPACTARMLDDQGQQPSQVLATRPFAIEFEYALDEPINSLRVGVYLDLEGGGGLQLL